MACAFLCRGTSARSRDSAGSRPRWLLTIDNARINPETHERWYLRVCTRLLFQNLRVLSSLRIQISCFVGFARGPSSPDHRCRRGGILSPLVNAPDVREISPFVLETYAISPRYTVVSEDADARMGSFGWKSTSVTAPLCPGK